MSDNEIIKSLECCCDRLRCSECSFAFKGGCTLKLRTRALDLINRQQAEIERLESLVKTQGIEIDELNNFANERLDKFTERYDRNLRAEAIKEFAERLGEYIEYRYNENCDFVPYVRLSDIEKVEKEMVGIENET